MIRRRNARSTVPALAIACGFATTLGTQARGGRRAAGPSLRDTVGALLAIAERGDVNLRRACHLARDSATRRWSIVQWFTHRIT